MYNALICKIKVKPFPGADRLQLGNVLGEQVVVGLETHDGDLGIYFPCDGRLHEAFCVANDLLVRKDPETGKKIGGGYFDDRRKVRAQKFRGERSDGFWCPISYLASIPGIDLGLVSALREGDQLTKIGDIEICEKYLTKGTRNSGGQNAVKKMHRRNPRFPMHYDTEQLRYSVGKIQDGDLLYFTEKLHGCVDRDTIVDTLEHGKCCIGQLVDKKEAVHIKSFDFGLNQEVFSLVEAFHFEPNSDDWLEVELEDGTKLTITGNNPVWLPELSCYRKSDELIIGDVVALENLQ